MRYVSFRRPDGTPSFGRLDGETIVELATEATPSLKAALTDGSLATLPDGASFAAADIVLRSFIAYLHGKGRPRGCRPARRLRRSRPYRR